VFAQAVKQDDRECMKRRLAEKEDYVARMKETITVYGEHCQGFQRKAPMKKDDGAQPELITESPACPPRSAYDKVELSPSQSEPEPRSEPAGTLLGGFKKGETVEVISSRTLKKNGLAVGARGVVKGRSKDRLEVEFDGRFFRVNPTKIRRVNPDNEQSSSDSERLPDMTSKGPHPGTVETQGPEDHLQNEAPAMPPKRVTREIQDVTDSEEKEGDEIYESATEDEAELEPSKLNEPGAGPPCPEGSNDSGASDSSSRLPFGNGLRRRLMLTDARGATLCGAGIMIAGFLAHRLYRWWNAKPRMTEDCEEP